MLVIFDLDGTLIDSARDLAIATNQTRAHYGLPPLDPHVIQTYVGNGAAMLVKRAFGAETSEETLADALIFFMRYYRAHSMANTRLYPGISELIHALAAAKHTLAVLTNKPVRISRDILAALGIGSLFMRIYGGDSLEEKKPDPRGINQLLEEAGAAKHEAWMVGDSAVDVQTARNAGVKCCGVTWGFRPDTLETDRPDVLISEPYELLRVIAKGA